MPHQIAEYRDALNSLIGPIEELMAKLNEISLGENISVGHPAIAYTLGGLEQAKSTLEDYVTEIDEYEEEAEPDEPDADEDDGDGDLDEADEDEDE